MIEEVISENIVFVITKFNLYINKERAPLFSISRIITLNMPKKILNVDIFLRWGVGVQITLAVHTFSFVK